MSTPSEVRSELAQALKLDLVGHDNAHAFAHELLVDAPSRWYLSGFLVPAEAPVEQKTDAIFNEEVCGHAALMVRNNEGLIKTYNRFHAPQGRSPDLQTLRELHARMDAAVLAASGWTDLPTACDFILNCEEDEAEEPTARKPKEP